jgi:RNA polymerase sigma factor (sigma-70 family)
MSRSDPSPAGKFEEHDEDVRLMGLIRAVYTAAFEQLVERHQMLVVGTVGRMLGSNSDVDDIAQQVFIRVWKSAGRYVPRAKFTTWLLKITRNLVFSELRETPPLRCKWIRRGRNSAQGRACIPDTAALERPRRAIAQLPDTDGGHSASL